MKLKKKAVFGICVGLIIILAIIIIAFPLLEKMKSKNKNEKAIQAVVEQIFTCPNEELIKLYSDMSEAVDDKIDSLSPDIKIYSLTDEDFSKIENKLEEMYAPYILSSWYESFMKHMQMNFVIYSISKDYEIEVDHIEITQNETISTNYSFTIDIHYGLIDGEKKDIEIKGSAQFTDVNGKISYIKIFDNELRSELQE